jgi:hypothetical protein
MIGIIICLLDNAKSESRSIKKAWAVFLPVCDLPRRFSPKKERAAIVVNEKMGGMNRHDIPAGILLRK